MPVTAQITGTENVMDWHEWNGRTPYWSVWSGKQILFSWDANDLTAGRDLLQQNLQLFENQGLTDLWTLKIHPEHNGRGIDDKSPTISSLNFRPAAANQAVLAGQQLDFPRNPGLQAIAGKLELMEAKLSAMETPAAAEDSGGIMGAINKMMEVPGFAEAAAPLVAGLVGKLGSMLNLPMPDANATAASIAAAAQAGPAAVAGIGGDNQDDKVDRALEILEEGNDNLGDDLLILAQLKQQNPEQFNGMLQMLRGNGPA